MYYGFPSTEPDECKTCQLQCHDGKVSARGIPESTDLLEIIISSTATYTPVIRHEDPPTKVTEHIPIRLSIYQTAAKLELWQDGFLYHTEEIKCEASSICDQISCSFCSIHLANQQCYSWLLTSVIITIFTFFPTLVLALIYQLVTGMWIPSWSIPSIRNWPCLPNRLRNSVMYQLNRRPITDLELEIIQEENEYDEIPADTSVYASTIRVPKSPNSRRPAYLRSTTPSGSLYNLTFITIISIYITMATGCRQATTLTAETHQCEIKNGKQLCSINEVTRMTTGTTVTCLIVHDNHGRPNGRLTVTIDHVVSRCEKASLYHTRSFATKIEAVKRCTNAGSCTGTTCSLLTHDSAITELSKEANTALGFSRCTESCGCISCGCFYCTSACIFYREYVKPTTPAIFEVFRCPAYRHEVQLTIQLQTEGEVQSETIVLQATAETSLFDNKLNAALISFSEPIRPLMNSTFVSDGTRTAIIDAAPSGVPLVGITGQLQCPTRKAALNDTLMECFTATGACQCDPRENTIACECVDVSIESQFKHQNVLPVQTTTQWIKPSGASGVIIYEVQEVLVELQLEFNGLQLSTTFHEDQCVATIHQIAGCYSCISGANIQLSCHSPHKNIALISCDSHNKYTLSCSPSSPITNVRVHYDNSHAQDTCRVTCGSASNGTVFHIDTTLSYIPISLQGSRHDFNGPANPIQGSFDWNSLLTSSFPNPDDQQDHKHCDYCSDHYYCCIPCSFHLLFLELCGSIITLIKECNDYCHPILGIIFVSVKLGCVKILL
jgi:hypothetical protein